MPRCGMDRAELQREVEGVKSSVEAQLESASLCLSDHSRHPGEAILSRKYTYNDALFALVWPCLMLGGGALLVVLVKLTQCLAHLSAEMCSETAGGRLTSRHTRRKLSRLLRRSS